MKKIFIFAIITIFMFCLTGCEKESKTTSNTATTSQNNTSTSKVAKKDSNENLIFQSYNTNYNMESMFNEVADNTPLRDTDKLSNEEAIEKYYLSNYKDIEFSVWSNITSQNINEIAMIKIVNTDQTQSIIKDSISQRIAYLKDFFSNNEYITNILNDPNKVIIEINDGVAIVSIGNNAKEIMQKLTAPLKVEE